MQKISLIYLPWLLFYHMLYMIKTTVQDFLHGGQKKCSKKLGNLSKFVWWANFTKTNRTMELFQLNTVLIREKIPTY